MRRGDSLVLLGGVLLVALCSLVYELLAGTVASYLYGSSVVQFSLVIGVFLSAMGVGSFLSRLVRAQLVAAFITIELLVGLAGGLSAMALFAAFALDVHFLAALVAVTGTVGVLIGMEIPLILRILQQRLAALRITVANVMAVDYIGALAASLAFPFLLLPHLGLMRASFAAGLLNVAVGWVVLIRFRAAVQHFGRLAALAGGATVVLAGGLAGSGQLVSFFEARLYPDEVIYATQTPYQRIVITHWKGDVRLFLNGKIQFSSRDEYRYHESLVHPAMSLADHPRRICILGGGDGLAVREILKHPGVRRIDLVDLDPEMTRLFGENEMLVRLNAGSLRDPRVHVHNVDAMKYLERTDRRYDVILADLPDPSNTDVGKLYTRSFYALVKRRLADRGVFVTQAGSPYFATEAFWCIANTLASVPVPEIAPNAVLHVLAYHATVPSFGEWGFVLASPRPLRGAEVPIDVPTRYLTEEVFAAQRSFPPDIAHRTTEINRLDNQILVRYYTRGYRRFYE